MFAPKIAFIDVETTGANPVVDRVTEIAILRIEDGVLVERWSNLVNPGMAIPPTIQGFTGITDAMVADARPLPSWPTGAGAARRLRVRGPQRALRLRPSRTSSRASASASTRRCCAPSSCPGALPQHHRHGLDALIARHNLTCSARHRAMGDTEALFQFAGIVADEFPPGSSASPSPRP